MLFSTFLRECANIGTFTCTKQHLVGLETNEISVKIKIICQIWGTEWLSGSFTCVCVCVWERECVCVSECARGYIPMRVFHNYGRCTENSFDICIWYIGYWYQFSKMFVFLKKREYCVFCDMYTITSPAISANLWCQLYFCSMAKNH